MKFRARGQSFKLILIFRRRIKEQSLGDFISHKDGKGFEGNDRNPRNISEKRIPEEK